MDKIVPGDYITDNDPTPLTVPIVANWFTTSIQTLELTDDQLAWYIAQGWEKTGGWSVVNGDGSTSSHHILTRTSIKSKQVMQDLIEDYVDAYNTGRELNDQRYDDIIALYSAMLDKTEDEYDDFTTEDNAYEVLIEAIIAAMESDFNTYNTVVQAYINNMIARRDTYNTLIDTFKTDTEAVQGAYETAIDTLIAAIEADQTAYESTIESLNTTVGTDHTSYKNLVTTLLTTMGADYNNFYAVVIPLLSTISTDHATFSGDMDGILDDYGDSMTDQINTRFDNKLASERANLVSRGLYNSTIWTSVSTGIERERSLALTDLADKITQQTVGITQNVHNALVGMRDRTLAARERLNVVLTNVRTQGISSYGQIHSFLRDMQQQVFSGLRDIQANLRAAWNSKLTGDNLKFQSGMDVVKVIMAARDQSYARVDAVEAERSRTEARVYADKASMRDRILAARDRLQATLHASTDKQLTSRNMIIEALNNFMEHRTDSYPNLEELTKLAGLLGVGDTSGLIAP